MGRRNPRNHLTISGRACASRRLPSTERGRARRRRRPTRAPRRAPRPRRSRPVRPRARRRGAPARDVARPEATLVFQPRGVAQLAEHRSPKPGVGGSSPLAPAPANKPRPAWKGGFGVLVARLCRPLGYAEQCSRPSQDSLAASGPARARHKPCTRTCRQAQRSRDSQADRPPALPVPVPAKGLRLAAGVQAVL